MTTSTDLPTGAKPLTATKERTPSSAPSEQLGAKRSTSSNRATPLAAEPEQCKHGLDDGTCYLCNHPKAEEKAETLYSMLRDAFEEYGHEDWELVLRIVLAEVLSRDDAADLLLPALADQARKVIRNIRIRSEQDALKYLSGPSVEPPQLGTSDETFPMIVTSLAEPLQQEANAGAFPKVLTPPAEHFEPEATDTTTPRAVTPRADLSPETIRPASSRNGTSPANTSQPEASPFTAPKELTPRVGKLAPVPEGMTPAQFSRSRQEVARAAGLEWAESFARRVAHTVVKFEGREVQYGEMTIDEHARRRARLMQQASGIADGIKFEDKALHILRVYQVPTLNAYLKGLGK